MIIDPRDQDLRANYKLIIGSVLPRPIAFVSTADGDGRPNLAPFRRSASRPCAASRTDRRRTPCATSATPTNS